MKINLIVGVILILLVLASFGIGVFPGFLGFGMLFAIPIILLGIAFSLSTAGGIIVLIGCAGWLFSSFVSADTSPVVVPALSWGFIYGGFLFAIYDGIKKLIKSFRK